ncbi:pectinesterase family protein [Ereboglobus luteus]|uniref:Ig-like domain-containing protein n=1 Tax=Ereboglobus luteus TaxID=1796921 RepID=A0A2U8E1P1_9BACT|nr:pectinesterase family protein [Ereboglobus luteus]AWI08751.1 hypothetical protein CKA38_05325 [Ereboglobus luteus]
MVIPTGARRTVQGKEYFYQPIAIFGNEAWITLGPGQRLAYGKTYYVNIESAVLLDSDGASLPAITDATTWRFSTKTAGPATPTATTGPTTITVGHDGAGDFATLQAASDWIPQNNTLPRTIVIKPGTYRDNTTFSQNRNFVTVHGDGAQRADVVLYYEYPYYTTDRGAAVLNIECNDINVINLTIDNRVYFPHPATNAPAWIGTVNTVYTSGSRVVFDNVLMKGGQDTLYTDKGIATFHNSEIWGSVDFIYGGALAIFDQCDIVQIRSTGGPIGAPSTPLAQPHGIVFLNCNFPKALMSNGYPYDVGAANTTFMRPWRQDGHTASINGMLSDIFTAKGWGEWDGREATCRAVELGSTLAGGGSVTTEQRHTSGAYWVNTIDPDYTGATDEYVGNPNLLLPDGPANRTAITVTAADYTLEAILGNSYYSLAGWLPTAKPKILAQPVAQSVDETDPVTLSVSAWSPRFQTYQWYKDSAPISGATGDTYALTSATELDSGSYYVVVTSNQGSTTSDTVTVTVNSNTPTGIPVIATQPESQTFVMGDTVTFSVAATGGGLSYQWYKDGIAIPGETGASLTLNGVNLSDAGEYHVVISNTFGDTPSSTITLTYDTTAPKPAVFVKLHRDQDSAGAAPVAAEKLTVAVQGSGWDYTAAAPYAGTTWNKIRRPHGTDLISSGTAGGTYPGVIGTVATLNTADNIKLFSPDGTDSGVKFTAQVHINALDGVRQEPNAGYIGGYTETLMPAAVVNDLWRLIIGDNTFTFTFSDLPPSSRYLVYVYGALNNGNARFDLAPDNVADTNAKWVGIYATNNNASTHVFAKDLEDNIAPVAPAPPEDTTTDIDKPWGVLPALTDAAGQLVISATKFNGSTYVAGFQLIPYPVATITTQPAATELVDLDDNITLTVVAAGFDSSDTLSYQWRKDGADIDTLANATAATASLTITGAQSADAGSYDVVITNLGGAVTSTACALAVNDGSATEIPAITAQPVSLVTDAGDAVTLSVDATGGGLSYQWYKDGVLIPGATGATLDIANPQASDTGSYHVVITNSFGDTTSTTVTLTVESTAAAPAVFIKLHRDQASSAGVQSAAEMLTVAVQGSGWDYSGAAPYAGTTWNKIRRPNSADMINSGTAGGTYPGVIGAVETLNTANNISLYAPDGTASAVTLTTKITINALNADRQEPNAGYIGGYTETLMPAAVVNDLWRLIVGDNTFTFTFNNLPAGGRYLAYVYGALNNGNARFDLAPANVASTNARWVGIYATNSNASTHVFAKDIENNVAPVAPAPPEDSTTTIDKPWGVLPAIIDAGGQLVISATKFNGSTYVAGFQLIPYPKATIITQPATTEVAVAGNTATLTVVAAGFDSNDTVTYQWRKDGAPINTADNATANTASLVITDAQDADAGSYDVVVTNYGGSTTSTACALSISGSSAESAPAITAQPVSQITDAGDSVTLSVDATGGALAYQWYKDGVAIPGANGATLTIDNPQSSDAGSYHVVITNNLGEATSDSVTLTVEGATAAPALFVKLTRQSAAASAAPTAAATFTLAAPGSGWNYSAAAPYPGTTWNTIQRPADADSTNLSTVIGTYVLNTGSNIALTAADGTASGVSLTASLDVTSASNARAEPGYSSPTVDSVLGPEALMNGNGIWRIYYGSNNTIWEFAGLPAGTHYLAYGYGSTNSAGQGARFLLATSNTTAGAATWFETAGAASASVFVDTDSVISPRAPVMPEVLSSAASNTETTWGVLHGKVDAAGKFTVQTTKNANNGQYIAGFQLIPYPKTVIDVDAPSTLSVPAGGTATIPVTALGFDANDSVTYQWRKDGVAINTADNATANTATLVIADAQLADEADYDLVITNYGGSIISGVCELTVLPGVGAPTIYTQPVSQTAVTNATANFSAAVGGLAPLTYVWQKSSTGVDADFVDIPGATNSALVLAGVTTADAGYYRIKITNDEGSATSDTVTLIIAPVITTQPETAVVTIGSPASVSVVADTGIAAAPFAPTYQWRLDGVDIPGATSATYSIASFNSATDEGSYTVVVTNAAGSVTSDAAVLCDPVLPVFTTQPAAAQTVVTGMNVTFVSSATGIPAPAYQWNYNGAPITSATNATYTITGAALADTGTYTVVATNMAGSTPSDPSILTVRDAAGPAAVSDGFGSEATGGAGGAVYVVTNATDLLAKAALDEPAIITVSGTISLLGVSNKRAPVKSNKTIQGADANATIIGEIQISYVDNVIVRGLTITNPGETIDTDPGSPTYGKYIDSGDGINVWGSTNVFITHCTLFNCGDGCIDITRAEVDNVTVSWCKFYYTDALAHRFTMILGNIETDNPDYIGPVHTTLHHNWWAEFCHERMPASTGGRVHMYDNYFSCAGNFYASNARNNTQLFVEHSYYGTGVNSPVGKSAGTSALIRTIDNIYNGTTGTIDPGTDTVFTPPYSYHLNAAGDLPVLIPQYGGNTDGAFSITPAVAAPLSVVASSTIPFHGDTVTLVPSLGGAGTAYQWRLNNFDIPGATSETLTLANIQSAQLGAYTVVVTTAADKHTVSAPVTITFGDAPSFSGLNGGAITAISGKAVTLNPSVNGAGLVYQWQRFVDGGWIDLADNATYSGANTGSLTIGNIGDAQAGDYRLVVSNPSGSATGNPYTVSVAPVLFPYPTGVAVDSYGDLYIADSALNVVRKVAASGSTAVLYAGIPNTAGYKDGAFGVSMFNAPAALAIDASGNLYVADTGNAVVRRVNRDGSLETLAGDPSGRGNRDGIGTAVLFSSPNGLSFDRTTGVTYLADTNNHTIRRLTPINPSSGVYVGNTVATIGGIPGSSGDNDAWLVDSGTAMILSGTGRYNHPAAVAFSGSFLYIADAGNNTIRKLTVASGTNFGVVQTIAGTPGVNGSDDGPGLTALFDQPKSIVVDASGANIYVADTGNHTIRKVTPAGDVITLAGLATVSGQSDGEGMNALFNQPTALALDSSGRTLYVADTGNAAVRKIAISGTSATVTTLAVTLVSDTMPPSGTTPPFNPSSDGKGDGGGGAPSHWFFGALVALALLRLVRRGRKA